MSSQRDDMKSSSPADATQYDAIIVGAGFAGLYAVHRLRGMGLRVRAYEAGTDVGGTWFWNRYPGARCDVASMEYSYSFSNELQQEWNWTERFPTQPEILRYINHVADRFDLRRDIQFSTRVVSCEFSEDSRRWTVQTDQGDRVSAPFCIMASGCLSTAKVPDMKGLDQFEGKWFHSGQWPTEGVDFSGQRVGVVGTGSSGIQIIPEIAKSAGHLTVFQRTANFSIPANNGPIDPELVRSFKENYAERRERARQSPDGMIGIRPTKSALEATPEERQSLYQSRWDNYGVIGILTSYNDLLTNREANDTASEFVRSKIRETVRDPAVAELLVPKGHYIGTKRLCQDTNYFETYNRDNVSLVDVKSDPIQEVTRHGIRTQNREYPLDAIVFATGFDAVTGALLNIDIRSGNGETLAGKWGEGPRAYLGLMMAGFPNMFIITGPGSPSVKGNMVHSIEQHVNWIADCLDHLRSNKLTRIEADAQFEDRWVDHVREVADGTLFPTADSWYVGANIPGKPRVFLPYVGGIPAYREICERIVANGYEGFSFS